MSTPLRSKGVSLVEVLIALVVISIGLLGIAKMQALAMASTRGSSTRSLISIEAASLASAMHANRKYWNAVSTSAVQFSAGVANGVITNPTDTALNGAWTDCTAASCSLSAMAEFDLIAWSKALNAVTPGSTGLVTCAGQPAACTITVTWTENMVGMNASTQYVAGSQTQTLSYSLLVDPGV